MPLNDSQWLEMYGWLREVHGWLKARHRTSPTVGAVVTASKPAATHNPDDPSIKFDPKGYSGPPMKGKPMSSCTPGYLRTYAVMMDGCADRNEAKPYYTVNNTMDAVLVLPGYCSLAPGNNSLLPSDWSAMRTSPLVREAMQRGMITVRDPSSTLITSTAAPVQQLKSGTATTVYSAYTLSDGP